MFQSCSSRQRAGKIARKWPPLPGPLLEGSGVDVAGGRSAVVRSATTLSLRRPPFAPVLAAEVARRHADKPVERTREGRLVAETGLAGDVDGRCIGQREQLLRALHPAIHEPAMAAHAEARLERPCEVADRQVARAC